MALGAGGPRSYHGARFPGIPGFSGLSPQSHGALKVDRQTAYQHISIWHGLTIPRADWRSQLGATARSTSMLVFVLFITFYHAERLCIPSYICARTSSRLSFSCVYLLCSGNKVLFKLIIPRATILCSPFQSLIFFCKKYIKEIYLNL